MTEKNLVKAYTTATSEKRIDIIIKNYTEFIGIVDGYTDGLRYMIEIFRVMSWTVLTMRKYISGMHTFSKI